MSDAPTITPPTLEQIAVARLAAIEATHYASWLWDEATTTYLPPVQPPIVGKPYIWDEPTLAWVHFPDYPI